MSKKEKLLSVPADFTYQEIKTLLEFLGYEENQKGKSSGSRVQFEKLNSLIRFHKPHPKPILKEYQLKEIIAELKRTGVI